MNDYTIQERILMDTGDIYCHGKSIEKGRHAARIMDHYEGNPHNPETKLENLIPLHFRKPTVEEKEEFCKFCI